MALGVDHGLANADRTELLQESVYQDAAHSMAAIGMIAPLFEAILCAYFQSVGSRRVHVAGVRAVASDHIYWDCHLVLENGHVRKDIVKGARQLADDVGLTAYLPTDFFVTLAAVFAYRNKMVHNGLEWTPRERKRFAQTIQESTWSAEWFVRASISGKPWIFYMSDEFIGHCINTAEALLDACGNQARASNS